jgi:hypothetical protein
MNLNIKYFLEKDFVENKNINIEKNIKIPSSLDFETIF